MGTKRYQGVHDSVIEASSKADEAFGRLEALVEYDSEKRAERMHYLAKRLDHVCAELWDIEVKLNEEEKGGDE